MNKKKIWILNHYAIPRGMFGGTRHFDFAYELEKRGYDVTIFASSFNHFNRKDVLEENEKIRVEKIDGVRFIWMRTWPHYSNNGIKRLLNMFSYFLRMLEIYKKFEKPDIVIGSSVHLFACLAAYFISRKTKSRFICEIRDLWPQTLIDMGAISNNHPIAALFRQIERFVYKKAEKIIILLPGMPEYLRRYSVDKSKIVYIPNGVDIRKFDDDLNDPATQLSSEMENILNGNFVCVYTGSIGVANCIDTIIEAAELINEKRLNKVKFVLIGEGSERQRLLEYCNAKGIANVLFFSAVKKELIPKILELSDIAVVVAQDIPLYKYGISFNKLFDYLCGRKPVIFACNASNDIIKESGAGLSIEPENPEALSKAVELLFNSTEEDRKILGQNGRDYVEKNHSISLLVDRLERTFNELG